MSGGDWVVGNGKAACLLDVRGHVGRGGPEEGPLAEAWGHLYPVCSELLECLAGGYRLQPADADDVRQQVWLEVGKRLPHLMARMEPGRFEAWLKKVLWSKVADLHRHRTRHSAEALGDIVGTEREPAAREKDPAEEDDRDERSRRVREIGERLARNGDKDAYIFVLRHVEGWKTADVAAALDLTAAQVCDRLWRGTRKIQAAMGLDAPAGRRRRRRAAAQGG